MPLLHQYTFSYLTTAKTGKPQASPCHIATHPRVFARFLAGVSRITPISDHFCYTPTSFCPISCRCVPEAGQLQPKTRPSHEFLPDFLHVCPESPTFLPFFTTHPRVFPRFFACVSLEDLYRVKITSISVAAGQVFASRVNFRRFLVVARS